MSTEVMYRYTTNGGLVSWAGWLVADKCGMRGDL